ncbi:MAG: nucleotidyltransferase substrate binding protein [Casimicrobiaceae bacterium]
MADLRARLAVAQRAWASLEALASEPFSTVVRDATIKRFEYAVETAWKAAQAVLDRRFGVMLASPKPIVRACLANGLLSEADARAALVMLDQRNLTAHTYNETLASEIFAAIDGHRALLRRWLDALDQAAEAGE